MLESRRPVLYVGGGTIRSGASAELRTLAELTGMPVVTTLMARGAFPDSHPQHLGMPGMHGTVAAVAALQKSDLIISLGARFDDRVTGNLDSFAPGAQVIHADIDPAEIGKNRHADVPIVGDVREVHRRPGRRAAGRGRRRATPATTRAGSQFLAGVEGDVPARLRHARGRRSRRSTSSSGSARSPARTRSTPPASASTRCGRRTTSATRSRRTWINSGGLGTMGFAVPAAMGAKVGMPDSTVWAIDGDGCFQMTNQELATCAINDIPIKVAIINNESLGMVRQWQTLFYNERYSNTDLRLEADPRLRQARRGLRLRRPRLRQPRGRRRHDQQGDGDQRRARSSSTSGCTATPWSGRWSPPAPATTTSSTRATSRPSSTRTTSDEPATPCRSWSRTSPASWPGSPACSAAAASTSSRWRSARPSTPRSRG